MSKKILGVIPARSGSKGVPGKNIKQFCGKPLIQYIFDTAKESKLLDKIIISTDCEEIAEVAKSFGLDAPFLRPEELAVDNAKTIDVIKHVLKYYDKSGVKYDGIISLQATNPFTSLDTINKALKLFIDSNCDSVTTVTEVLKGHPYITKRLKNESKIESFCIIPEGIKIQSRQERETAYYLTGAIYLRSRQLIETEYNDKDSHHLGKDQRVVIVNEKEAIDINTNFDFRFAEWVKENSINL